MKRLIILSMFLFVAACGDEYAPSLITVDTPPGITEPGETEEEEPEITVYPLPSPSLDPSPSVSVEPSPSASPDPCKVKCKVKKGVITCECKHH